MKILRPIKRKSASFLLIAEGLPDGSMLLLVEFQAFAEGEMYGLACLVELAEVEADKFQSNVVFWPADKMPQGEEIDRLFLHILGDALSKAGISGGEFVSMPFPGH